MTLVVDEIKKAIEKLPKEELNKFNKEIYEHKEAFIAFFLYTILDKISDLERDVARIKKSLTEEPELRDDFISRIKDIEFERSIIVEDFGKRYGLK